MAATPKRASHCEKVLINSVLTKEIINEAKFALAKDFKPISDVRNSSKYRMEVAQNLLEKCFLEIQYKKLISVQ